MERPKEDILQFYAFSANKNPGQGIGDIINDPLIYENLKKYDNWRRMFSSFWDKDPFSFDDKMYLSFEHAYQQAKFRINGYINEADEFSLDSNSELSKLSGKDVQKAGRRITLNSKEIKLWNESMPGIKQRIYEAKFTSNTRPGIVLLLTQDAALINAGPRIKRIRCTRLEKLRTKLRS